MRVTSKGQVTIPQAIRDELGIQPGAEVSFAVRGDEIVVTLSEASQRGDGIVARLRGSGHHRMSTDEILALTRE